MSAPIENTPNAASLPRHRKTLLRLIGLAILILVGLLAVGILPRLGRSATLAQTSAAARTSIPEVTVVTPQWVSEGGLSLPGNIQAIKEATINARTTGYLRRLYVDIGSRVKAGQLLAEIESPDVDQQVYQARAQTAQSRAVVGQSQATVAQQQANVTQMQAQVAGQSATVEQARATLAGTYSKLTQSIAGEAQAVAQLAHTRQALNVQRSGLKQAEAQLALAQVTDVRYQDLLKQGFDSQQDADQAAATLKTAAAAVESAKASVLAAQSDVNSAQEGVTAGKAIVASARADVQAGIKSVAASEAALVSSQSTVSAAQASLQASRKNVQANQFAVLSNVANTSHYAVMRSFERVVAPFDGVITARNVDVGTLISAGTTGSTSAASTAPQTGMLGIARIDQVRIQVNVPQTYVQAIRSGNTAIVTVPNLPGSVFKGSVSLISGALDTLSRTQLVEVHLPNRDNSLVPGMYSQVRIAPAHPPTIIQIPGTALIINGVGTRVAVVSAASTVHLQQVQIGRDLGNVVEIVGGLKGDEKLVNNPSDTLAEGAQVRFPPAKSAG